MNGFGIALFLHLIALLAAFGASTIVHVAMLKARSAATGAEALPWLGLAHRLSPVFPVALAGLLGTGAWMLRSSWSWHAGFVEAGLAGVTFLFVSGAAVEGARGRKIAAALAARPAEPLGPDAAALLRDPLWWCASWSNTGVAVGVVFAMATKPSQGDAFAALAVGLVVGCAVALRLRRGSATVRFPRRLEQAAPSE